MKNRSLSFILLVAAALGLAAIGCASRKVVLRAAQTNTVPVLVTNTAPRVLQREIVSTRLNPVPGQPDIVTTNWVLETNLVERVETRTQEVVTPEVAYQEVALNPAVNTAVQVAGAVAPVPWAGAATGIFGAVAGSVIGWINNRRRKAALGEAQSWEDTATVLVKGVELVRTQAKALPGYTDKIDRQVVKVLEATQEAAGVKARVEGLVWKHTDSTADTPPLVPVDLAPAPVVPDLMGGAAGLAAPAPAMAPAALAATAQPSTRSMADLVDFAKGGQIPKRGEFSDSEIATIFQIRGQA